LRAESPSAAAMLDVPVECDEDITKFLRTNCVLSAAKLTDEIITEDRDSTVSEH
jgi:hypothetical protein